MGTNGSPVPESPEIESNQEESRQRGKRARGSLERLKPCGLKRDSQRGGTPLYTQGSAVRARHRPSRFPDRQALPRLGAAPRVSLNGGPFHARSIALSPPRGAWGTERHPRPTLLTLKIPAQRYTTSCSNQLGTRRGVHEK
jgi:hypothetical protein